MSKNDDNWKSKAAVAAGAAVGSAAIAAALLFVKKRKDKANDARPHPTGKAPPFPEDMD
ncbi:MAG: hypothetical protein R3D89_01270 [Sphingomonadaceae bacterium]|jgi:Na+/H+-translocating membrane pyrophosphatase